MPAAKGFDPDELALTKKDILEFCDRVLARWSSAERPKTAQTAYNILAMNAVRASVAWSDEASLRAVWSEIISWSFEIMYDNAMAHDAGTKWADALKEIKRKEAAGGRQ